jgi:hypothetical protein
MPPRPCHPYGQEESHNREAKSSACRPGVVGQGNFFTHSVPLAVFLLEIVCFGVLLHFFRRKEIPKLVKALVVSVHFIFWMLFLWSETRDYFFRFMREV